MLDEGVPSCLGHLWTHGTHGTQNTQKKPGSGERSQNLPRPLLDPRDPRDTEYSKKPSVGGRSQELPRPLLDPRDPRDTEYSVKPSVGGRSQNLPRFKSYPGHFGTLLTRRPVYVGWILDSLNHKNIALGATNKLLFKLQIYFFTFSLIRKIPDISYSKVKV